MHNFDVTMGFNQTTVMFCRSCGLSYRLTTYRDLGTTPGRAIWELMTMEKPDGEVLAVAPCRVELAIAGGEHE